MRYLQGFGEDEGFAKRLEGEAGDEERTEWVSKAPVLLMVAVAWLSPMPGGSLEQMDIPTVSPRAGDACPNSFPPGSVAGLKHIPCCNQRGDKM